jgi:hypothetical protein
VQTPPPENSIFEFLKLGGGVAGLVALGWKVVDEFGSHLRISLEVNEAKNEWVTVKTVVDNKGNRAKKIFYAILLIGPEVENVMDTARFLASKSGYMGSLLYTNDLQEFHVGQPVVHDSRALIPLPFYYSENIAVADETLTYRIPVTLSGWQTGVAYAVRFFLFPAGRRLHRSTQDSFVYYSSPRS